MKRKITTKRKKNCMKQFLDDDSIIIDLVTLELILKSTKNVIKDICNMEMIDISKEKTKIEMLVKYFYEYMPAKFPEKFIGDSFICSADELDDFACISKDKLAKILKLCKKDVQNLMTSRELSWDKKETAAELKAGLIRYHALFDM